MSNPNYSPKTHFKPYVPVIKKPARPLMFDVPDNVVAYINRLEEHYEDRVSRLKKRRSKSYYRPLKEKVVYIKPRDYVISAMKFDLIRFDSFRSKILRPSTITDLHRMMKMAKFFMVSGHKYDYTTTLVMLMAYPLEYFHPSTAQDLVAHVLGPINTNRLLKKLVKLEYLKTNRIGNQNIYYATPKGREAVDSFQREFRKEELNVDFYEKNFRRSFMRSGGPRGKKFNFLRGYKDIYGKSFQGQPTSTQSIESYYQKRKRRESSESKEG